MLSSVLLIVAFAAESGVPPEVRAYLDQRITVEHYVSTTGAFRRAHPIPRDEIDWLIAQHNEQLAKELGVADPPK